ASPSRGPKTQIEDEMYPLYAHCAFNLNPRACSIDTPLHTLVPYAHVDHLHPNAVIAIAASVNQERLCKEIYGDEVLYVPWQRPGFDIGLKIERMIADNPRARGVLLGHHGMSSWSDDDKTCYETALEIVERAALFIDQHDKRELTFGGNKHELLPERQRLRILVEVVPWLRGVMARGATSTDRRFVATLQHDDNMLRFVNSVDGPRLAQLGTSCPDHFLRTKIKPLFVEWDPNNGDLDLLKESIAKGLVEYREDYKSYYERHKRPDSPPMRDPSPTVVLIPGLAMIGSPTTQHQSPLPA